MSSDQTSRVWKLFVSAIPNPVECQGPLQLSASGSASPLPIMLWFYAPSCARRRATD